MTTLLQSRITVANIYNPQNQSKEELIAGFVVRQQQFKKLYKAIKEAKMQTPEQHYLILGRRGMGKTTLLLRLAYEIENDPDLNGWLIPLVFNEEEYGIRGLFKFWERVMELLEEKHSAFRFETEEIRRLSKENPNHDAYEKALFDWLSGELTRSGKKLILFVDNFGDMARKLSDAEAHRLRKILQTSADIRIFAASSVVLEAFYKYDHPFYEFFKTVELQGLNEKETRDLLLALSEHYKKEEVKRIVEENPGRVEALRRITGGVIRSMVLLFEIFADDEDGSAFHDLQIILDRVSPLYKHRMDDLSDQQQAIVEAIALNWDAISVKEIAEQTRLESKVVSAQLNQLEKNGIVEKRATRTKNHLYLIAERFFNIWFLMRLGRKADQKRVLWLVRFFEEWCDKDLIKSRAERHLEALRKGKFSPESAYFITQALALVKEIDVVIQHQLLKETQAYLSDKDGELASSLLPSDLDIILQGFEKWYLGEKKEAFSLLKSTKVIQNIPNFDIQQLAYDDSEETQTGMANLANAVGQVFMQMKNKPEAKKCFEFASQAGNKDAMFFLGFILLVEEGAEAGAENIKKAAELGSPMALFSQSLVAFELTIKENFLGIAKSVFKQYPEISIFAWNYARFLMWHNHFEEVWAIADKFVWDKSLEDMKFTPVTDFFMLALAKNQAQALYDIFTSPQGEEHQFKDRFKPMWYAILKKLDHPDFLRMGDELRQTVDEILVKAEQLAEEYK